MVSKANKHLILLVLSVLILAAFMISCGEVTVEYNNRGRLDGDYSADGITVYDGGTGLDAGSGVAVDSSGNVYVAGQSDNGADRDIIVLKYNSIGQLDNTFSADGIVTYDNAGNNEMGNDLVVDSDGNVYVSGYAFGGADYNVIVLKYDSTGTLDTTFDADGVQIFNAAAGIYEPSAIALDASDNIYVAGVAFGASDYDIVTLKYNATGALDTSFSTDGYVFYDGGVGNDSAGGIEIDANGNVYVSGTVNSGADNDIVTYKYDSTGMLDTTFSADGVVIYDGGNGADYANGIALDSGGNVFVTGRQDNGTDFDVVTLKYNTAGVLDPTFSTDGIQLFDGGNGNDAGRDIAIDATDRPVVVGYANTAASDFNVLAIRYDAYGVLDPTFDLSGNYDGVVSLDGIAGTPNLMDNGNGVAINSDGRILITGESDNGTDSDIFSIRLY